MDNLAKDKTSKLLVKYSIPAIIAMLVTCLYNTADRAFIGSMEGVGAYAISGLGVTMPLFTLIGAFGVAVSVGGSTNISIKLGAKEKEEAERLLGNTFALELLGGFVIMVLGLVFIDQILYAFGASAKTLPYAKDYMSVILLGAVVNLSGFSLNGAIRADGRPKLAATIMIVCSLLNLVFDPLFIFYFGFGISSIFIALLVQPINISDMQPGSTCMVTVIMSVVTIICMLIVGSPQVSELPAIYTPLLLIIVCIAYSPLDFAGKIMLGEVGNHSFAIALGICFYLIGGFWWLIVLSFVTVCLTAFVRRSTLKIFFNQRLGILNPTFGDFFMDVLTGGGLGDLFRRIILKTKQYDVENPFLIKLGFRRLLYNPYAPTHGSNEQNNAYKVRLDGS